MSPSPGSKAHRRFLYTAWHHNEHHAGSLNSNFGFFTAFMDLLMGTRFTPSDKASKRPNFRCTECRQGDSGGDPSSDAPIAAGHSELSEGRLTA